jgi:rhamnose transport system permease protein
VIKKALPVINIFSLWQMAISGLVIIIAVLFNARQETPKGGLILRDATKRRSDPMKISAQGAAA